MVKAVKKECRNESFCVDITKRIKGFIWYHIVNRNYKKYVYEQISKVSI